MTNISKEFLQNVIPQSHLVFLLLHSEDLLIAKDVFFSFKILISDQQNSALIVDFFVVFQIKKKIVC